MSKFRFTSIQRYAIFTVHGEVCYLCRKPINMRSFQVDHIIPESLEDTPEVYNSVIENYGLSSGFDINSYENWLPACSQCNNEKRAKIFEPVPIILIQLDKASKKAGKVKAIVNEVKATQSITKALAIIESATEQGILSEKYLKCIEPLLEFHITHREEPMKECPIHISPVYKVLNQQGNLLTVKGPYGTGVGHINPPPNSNFRCSTCGCSAWSGTRCVICGTQNDE